MRKQQVKHTQESTMHESSSSCITAEYTSVTNQTPVIKKKKRFNSSEEFIIYYQYYKKHILYRKEWTKET